MIGGIAALAVSFGAGIYVGFRHSKDIAYALAKAEKTAYSADMELRRITPRIAAECADAYEDIQRELVLDAREQELVEKRRKRLEKLDRVIEEYEKQE